MARSVLVFSSLVGITLFAVLLSLPQLVDIRRGSSTQLDGLHSLTAGVSEGSEETTAVETDGVTIPFVLQQSAIEGELFDLVNVDRQENGQSTLLFASQLLGIARQRAQAQVDQGYLNHYLSDGRIAFIALFEAETVVYRRAGENLARGGSDVFRADLVEAALMGSPTHRANILEPSYQYLAVGSVPDREGRQTLAQIFLNPGDSPPAEDLVLGIVVVFGKPDAEAGGIQVLNLR